jgi:hypothetical protein
MHKLSYQHKKKWVIKIMEFILMVALMLLFSKLVFNEFNDRVVLQSITTSLLILVASNWFFRKAVHPSNSFVSKKMWNSLPDVELESDENLRKQEGAAHFNGLEAVTGKLTLTNKRLVFLSHKYNTQNHREEISVDQIVTATPGEADKPNREKVFTLKLKNNESHRFVVHSSSEWINLLPH